MNDHDGLDPELKSLLAADAERAPDDAKSRVAMALAASVPSFAASGGAHAIVHLSKHAMSATRAYAMTAFAFAVGTAVGAAGLNALRPTAAKAPLERATMVDAGAPDVVPSAQPVPNAPVVLPVDEPANAAPDAGARAVHPSISPLSSSATDVAAERALLDESRTALNEGNATEALRTLDEHRARFPHGQLGEERDAMTIHALVLANRRDEAERRATTFRARTPNSLFLPMIDAALRGP